MSAAVALAEVAYENMDDVFVPIALGRDFEISL